MNKAVSRIAQLRKQKNWTQLELSRKLGVTENTIANWEKGRSGVEWIERIIKLCEIFGCNPKDLIDYVEDDETLKKSHSFSHEVSTDVNYREVDTKQGRLSKR